MAVPAALSVGATRRRRTVHPVGPRALSAPTVRDTRDGGWAALGVGALPFQVVAASSGTPARGTTTSPGRDHAGRRPRRTAAPGRSMVGPVPGGIGLGDGLRATPDPVPGRAA